MDATFTFEAVFHSQSFSVPGVCWHEGRKPSLAVVWQCCYLYLLLVPGVHLTLCEMGPQQMLPTYPVLDVFLAAVH